MRCYKISFQMCTYVISMSLILLYNQSKCYMKSRLQTTARHAKIVITPYNLKRAFLFPFKLAFDLYHYKLHQYYILYSIKDYSTSHCIRNIINVFDVESM